MHKETEVVYNRARLFEQVWARPMIHLAKEYGVSGVALAKTCRKLAIPLPGRGHWAKLAAGGVSKRPVLAPAPKGVPDEIRVARSQQPLGSAVKRDFGPPIPVPTELGEAHPLVRSSLSQLQKADSGRAHPKGDRPCLDIRATGPALERAFRIMDALLRALEGAGHKAELTKPKPWDGRELVASRTIVHVGEFTVQVEIVEGWRQVRVVPEPSKKQGKPSYWDSHPWTERVPNGRLKFRIRGKYGVRGSWEDTKSRLLENRVNELVQGVIDDATHQARERIAEAEARERVAAEERRRWEAEKRRERRSKLVLDLESRVADWRAAREIEAFALEVERRATSQGKAIDESSRLGRWLAWARRRAAALASDALESVLRRRDIPNCSLKAGELPAHLEAYRFRDILEFRAWY